MPQPYLGELRIFAGNFAPQGWAFCDGRSLSISANDALFALIGTLYGGDGQTSFNLPDLRGRLPVHQGGGVVVGALAGQETVTLNVQQIPAHTHPIGASGDAASTPSALSGFPAAASSNAYASEFAPESLSGSSVSISTGGSQPHSNMQPYLCVNFIMALQGNFPSQN